MNKRKARATARARARAEILRWHEEYVHYWEGRKSRPMVCRGVEFYQVGQNASHDFFVGADADGRKFIRAVGEEACDENGDPIVVEHVYEVVTFDGHYLGHY